MPAEKYELKQVKVRLKLKEAESLYSDEPLVTPDAAANVMAEALSEMDREYCCVVMLDNKLRAMAFNVISVGSIDQAIVPISNIFKAACLCNASEIMLFHNHPSGQAEKSEEDEQITKQLVKAGKLMGIPLIDHIIIGAGDRQRYSFRDNEPWLFDASQRYDALHDHAFIGPIKYMEDYHRETREHFRPVAGMDGEAVENAVKTHVQSILDDYGVHGTVVDAALTGERSQGLGDANADISVAVEFDGDITEANLKDALDIDGLKIGKLNVNIQPITAIESGRLPEVLSRQWEQEQEAARQQESSKIMEKVPDSFMLDDKPPEPEKAPKKRTRRKKQEYKPLQKIEEKEEQNFNMLDEQLNNQETPDQKLEREKEEKEPAKETSKRRTSVRKKLNDKKKVAEQNTRLEPEVCKEAKKKEVMAVK